MPIEIMWFDKEETIVYHRIHTTWNWEEFHKITGEWREMYIDKPYLIDFIVDIRGVSVYPPNILQEANRFLKKQPHNAGMTYIIGGNQLARTMAGTITRLFGFNAVFVSSVDEAHRLIMSHRKRAF